MDWVESGLEFFGCDENAPKKVFGGTDNALRIPLEPHRESDPQYLDYSKLHDELLESLMADATKRANDPKGSTDLDSSNSSFSFTHSSSLHLNHSTSSTVNSSFESSAFLDEETPESSGKQYQNKRGHKRPRGLKLHRRVMPTITNKPFSNEEKTMKRRLSYNSSFSSKSTVTTTTSKTTDTKTNQGDDSDAVRISLADLQDAQLPSPASFIHPQCRLQKDKGKGEPAGANICAKGRDHCLLKLKDKMSLLTRVALGEDAKHRGKADMKRRPARIAEIFPNFTETRSIIELKMGFLSMQYGILLRWDTTRTGKVTLVVLRKMCHESFYTKCKALQRVLPPPRPRKMVQAAAELPIYAVRNVVDNHAILQRPDGMEVALLEPPYRVDRPVAFAPTLLTIAVLYASGLSQTSNWTVQLCFANKTENILLTWDEGHRTFTPKLGEKLKHEIPPSGSLDLPSLEIRLFEHRQRRGKSRRCVSHMHVPLMGLEAQPNGKGASPKDMKIVSSHDPDACVTLSVMLQSDYAHWLRRELDARRREEVAAFVWKSPFRVVDLYDDSPLPGDEEDESMWEWICGIC
ncbi:expressed unknown protein [Seminavis robusta]|uniref:Uncharacterized protein n=1 Tax=Seminavis robusta TaxID=568900 RepID=A0A9N8E8G7_9STRA|nr:expressed unknown protein [Seminavis robusta]|eukprot:Sro799_g204090.1 n/a (576) ;mRNA; r:14696-16423